MFLTFHGPLQTLQCLVPLAGNPIKAATRLLELARLDFPEALAAYADVTDETDSREDVEVFCDRLSCDVGACRQACGGQWASRRETRHEVEARSIS